ncbi:hypothetical protein FB157_14533 [Streptomyces sp. BK340]|nr:hypothetical protein FB157_14533 [Streptomyces sp. BK340]
MPDPKAGGPIAEPMKTVTGGAVGGQLGLLHDRVTS